MRSLLAGKSAVVLAVVLGIFAVTPPGLEAADAISPQRNQPAVAEGPRGSSGRPSPDEHRPDAADVSPGDSGSESVFRHVPSLALLLATVLILLSVFRRRRAGRAADDAAGTSDTELGTQRARWLGTEGQTVASAQLDPSARWPEVVSHSNPSSKAEGGPERNHSVGTPVDTPAGTGTPTSSAQPVPMWGAELVVTRNGQSHSVGLTPGVVSIGSGEHCRVRVEGASIAEAHAVVSRVGSDLVLRRFGSADGEPGTASTRLELGSTFEIGDARFMVRLRDAARDQAAS